AKAPTAASNTRRSKRSRSSRTTRCGSSRSTRRRSRSCRRRNRRPGRVIGAPWAELAWLALAVIAAGVVTALLAGLFGVGGGAVVVPVLFEVFRVIQVPDSFRMQLCIGTSLEVIGPTAWRSYRAH